jgi:hypothetical protein
MIINVCEPFCHYHNHFCPISHIKTYTCASDKDAKEQNGDVGSFMLDVHTFQ